MNKLLTCLIAVMLFAIVGATEAYAKDKNSDKQPDVTAVFTVSPKMTCQNCEKKIKSNLRFEKGVKEIVTNIKAGTVTITYSPKSTDVEKITKAFKKIGYTAQVAE